MEQFRTSCSRSILRYSSSFHRSRSRRKMRTTPPWQMTRTLLLR